MCSPLFIYISELPARAREQLCRARWTTARICARIIALAPVAQLDRVSDSDSEGHRFDSCRVYHRRRKASFATPRKFLRGVRVCACVCSSRHKNADVRPAPRLCPSRKSRIFARGPRYRPTQKIIDFSRGDPDFASLKTIALLSDFCAAYGRLSPPVCLSGIMCPTAGVFAHTGRSLTLTDASCSVTISSPHDTRFSTSLRQESLAF